MCQEVEKYVSQDEINVLLMAGYAFHMFTARIHCIQETKKHRPGRGYDPSEGATLSWSCFISRHVNTLSSCQQQQPPPLPRARRLSQGVALLACGGWEGEEGRWQRWRPAPAAAQRLQTALSAGGGRGGVRGQTEPFLR